MSVARPLSRTYIINKLIAENHLRRYLGFEPMDEFSGN